MRVDEFRGEYVTVRMTIHECISLANAAHEYEKHLKSNPYDKKERRRLRKYGEILNACISALRSNGYTSD